MKKSFIKIGIAVILAAAAGIFLWEKGITGKKGYQKKAVVMAASPVSSKQDSTVSVAFIEGMEKFTFETFSSLIKEKAYTAATEGNQKREQEYVLPQEGYGNVLYSPLSLYYALAVVAKGAAGETQAELLKLLAVSDIKELSGQCGSLYSQLYENESDSQLRIANSLWIAARQSNGRKIRWQKDYLNTLVKDFYASLFLVDFQEANTYQYMTEWVSDQTGGLLTPDFNPSKEDKGRQQETGSQQVLAILNTIYIKDSWREAFWEGATKEEAFYLTKGGTVLVPMMRQETNGEFFLGERYTRAALELEKVGRMVFVLPKEGVSLEELLSSPEQLAEAFTGGERKEANIIWQVPKFSIEQKETEKIWREVLCKLGVEKAFLQAEADFSNLADIPIFVSKLEQGVKLIIEEDGIEAATYTYMGLKDGCEKPRALEETLEMILNRPFLYGIVYQGVYLFIGVCENPVE